MSTTPNTNAEAKLSDLKSRIDRANTSRIQAEERKAAADNRILELETQIRDMGVDPAHVDEEINRLSQEYNSNVGQVETLLAPFEELMRNAAANQPAQM